MNLLYPRSSLSKHKRRVVVTGAGIITALGNGWSANAEGFRSGPITLKDVTLFDVSRQRSHIAAEAHIPTLRTRRLSSRQVQRSDRAFKLLLLAGLEAWQQCGWSENANYPVVLGTTCGGMTLGQEIYRGMSQQAGRHGEQAWRIHRYQAQTQASDLCREFGITAQPVMIANACASGANAVGHAWELVRNGHAEKVLTGGYDALCELVYAGFDSLQALSCTPCRPFDAHRDGLSLGEGAAVIALESLESATARNARILGEIAGYAAATDIHHLTQPHPEGSAAVTTMREACSIAGVSAAQIDYINAHGTGTPLNDAAEAAAINVWAGEEASRIRVSSTKASVGHLLGGAGAVEVVVCLMSLLGQWLPPMITTRDVDASCRFRLIQMPEDACVEYALSNSFGFGGANASLVMRRWA